MSNATKSTKINTTRSTSSQAWKQINEQGLLPKMRLDVYNWIYSNGPATAREIERGTNRHANKRLSELRLQGVIQETRTRICNVTGRSVIEWDVTDSLPRSWKRETPIPKIIRHLKHVNSLEVAYYGPDDHTPLSVTVECTKCGEIVHELFPI